MKIQKFSPLTAMPITLKCARVKFSSSENISGKTVPADLLALSQLVGNPETKETVWVNACLGAGRRSLAPQFTSWASLKASLRIGGGATVAFLTLMLNFLTGIFFAGILAWAFSGMSLDLFMSQLVGPEHAGFLTSLLAGINFWTFLAVKSLKGRVAVAGSTSLLVLALFHSSLTAVLIGLGGSIIIGLVAVLSIAACGFLGSIFRDALPRNFDGGKIAGSATGFLIVPAAFMSFILFVALSHPPHDASGFSTASALIGAAIFSACIFCQGFAMALSSKSTSKAACCLMSTTVQAPLLVGLILAAYACALSFIASHLGLLITQDSNLVNWQTFGATKLFALLSTINATLCVSLAGGYVGAMINAVRYRKRRE